VVSGTGLVVCIVALSITYLFKDWLSPHITPMNPSQIQGVTLHLKNAGVHPIDWKPVASGSHGLCAFELNPIAKGKLKSDLDSGKWLNYSSSILVKSLPSTKIFLHQRENFVVVKTYDIHEEEDIYTISQTVSFADDVLKAADNGTLRR